MIDDLAEEIDFNTIVEKEGRYSLYFKVGSSPWYSDVHFTKYKDYMLWKLKEEVKSL